MPDPIASVPTIVATLLIGATLAFHPHTAAAHCDTMNGPVVQDARAALSSGDLQPVLKWVTATDEADVRDAFARTLAVRDRGADVRELADRYFFETVVRLHRLSEGVGFTGLKPATAVDPAVAAADHALENGSPEELQTLLTDAVREAVRQRFADVHAARAHSTHSVEAGRAYVAAYVRFTHLAEEIAAVTRHALGSPSPADSASHTH